MDFLVVYLFFSDNFNAKCISSCLVMKRFSLPSLGNFLFPSSTIRKTTPNGMIICVGDENLLSPNPIPMIMDSDIAELLVFTILLTRLLYTLNLLLFPSSLLIISLIPFLISPQRGVIHHPGYSISSVCVLPTHSLVYTILILNHSQVLASREESWSQTQGAITLFRVYDWLEDN